MASGIGKKVGSLLERLETVEQTLPAMANAIQQVVNQLTQRLNNLDRVVMALVELTGKDQVSAAVESMARAEANEAADKAKANLDKAIEAGQAVATAAVGDSTLVVGQGTDKNGDVTVPSRIQMAFETFPAPTQDLLRGKGVGDVVDTENGGKFTIQEIYNLLPEVPPVAATDVVEATV